MIVPFFLLLLVIGLLLLWRRRRRSGPVFIVLALAWLFYAGCGPLTGTLLGNLQSGFPPDVTSWGQRNYIILLGAGTVRSGAGVVEPSFYANGRILRATELYRSCKATGAECKLEVSGGDAMKLGRSEAETYAITLDRLGVPRADLVLEGNSMNTFQNAQFTQPLLKTFGADKVVLVSSGVHLKRSVLYFAHFGIRAEPVRGDYVNARYDWLPSSENIFYADFAIHEYTGIICYHLYNAMGWNVPKIPEENLTAPTHT